MMAPISVFELDEHESIDLGIVQNSLCISNGVSPIRLVLSQEVREARAALYTLVPIVTAMTSLLNFGVNRNCFTSRACSQVLAIGSSHIGPQNAVLSRFKSCGLPRNVAGMVGEFLNSLSNALLVTNLIAPSAPIEHSSDDFAKAANQWRTTCSQLQRALRALLSIEAQYYVAEYNSGERVHFDFDADLVEAAVGGWPSANENGELNITSFVEKRTSPRMLVSLNCIIKTEESSENATIFDISDSGFGLITNFHLSKGAETEVLTPNGQSARCRVAWSGKGRCGLSVTEKLFEMRSFLKFLLLGNSAR